MRKDTKNNRRALQNARSSRGELKRDKTGEGYASKPKLITCIDWTFKKRLITNAIQMIEAREA